MINKQTKPSRIKQAIARLLGLGPEYYSEWADFYGRSSSSGVAVSAEKALTLSTVWACTRLLSQTVATLPLGVYKRTKAGRDPADDLPIARVIQFKPNADTTAVMFWEQLVGNVVLRGNGFAQKQMINGRVVALRILRNDRLTWSRQQSGAYLFRYTEDDGTYITLTEKEVFHVPGFSLGGKFGMSTIKYGVEVIGSSLAANTAASSMFKNGLMSSVYFKMERILNPKQREEFREGLDSLKGAVNAGKTPLLEGGMDMGNVGINPDDAQLLESRIFGVEELCRWFGVPPQLIFGGDKASSWASSSEQINLWFLQYGLRALLKRIEQAIWDQLFTTTEQVQYYAEFSVEGLLRGDTAARTTLYASALQNGWMNRDTVRRLENLPPIPGGDIYTAGANLVPLGQLGTQAKPMAAVKSLVEEITQILENAK